MIQYAAPRRFFPQRLRILDARFRGHDGREVGRVGLGYFIAEKRFSNEFACMIGAEPATTALAGAAGAAA